MGAPYDRRVCSATQLASQHVRRLNNVNHVHEGSRDQGRLPQKTWWMTQTMGASAVGAATGGAAATSATALGAAKTGTAEAGVVPVARRWRVWPLVRRRQRRR